MILGQRAYRVTVNGASFVVLDHPGDATDFYREMGWQIEEVFVFTKAELDANYAEAKAVPQPDVRRTMLAKPVVRCSICNGNDFTPTAVWVGDGWDLFWSCNICGPDGISWQHAYIEWPFADDNRGQDDLVKLGFVIA